MTGIIEFSTDTLNIEVSGINNNIPVDLVEVISTGQDVFVNVESNYGPVLAVNGRIGFVNLDKSDVGLSNVENISITGVSGYLQYQIDNLDTGYASQAEIDLLSGLLAQTGFYLHTTINNLSGVIVTGYATKIELNNTGSFLYNLINSLSGYGNNTFASIANLAATGSSLNNKINNLSGYSNNAFATIINLASTGQNLQNQINNLDLNYASQTEFNSLSGNLISTGANLQSQINSLYGSGFLTGVDLSPYYLKSNPSGFITGVDLSNYATLNNLASTGQNLQNQINNLDNVYATDTSLAQTGQFLDQKIDTFSGTYQNFVNNLDANYASQSEFNTLSGNLNLTSQNLDDKINNLSGVAVLIYGDQYIDGQKIFRGEVRIKDLYVTGTETIVNTTNTNVGSNYILLNATGGAIDAGIFIVTGNGLTGINNTGAIIGYDVPSNRWVFGNASRSDDLNQLEQIAGITDIANYSGFVNNNFYSINNPNGYITGIENIVYTTGDQTIGGLKTFSSGIFVTGGTINLAGRDIEGIANPIGESVTIRGGSGIGNGNFLSNPIGGDVTVIGGTALSGGLPGVSPGNVNIIGGSGGNLQAFIALPDTVGSINLYGGARISDSRGGPIIAHGNIYINPDPINSREFIIYKTGYAPFIGAADNLVVRQDSVNVNNLLTVSGNPVLTGVNLSNYATTGQLNQTGAALQSQISQTSGNLQSQLTQASGTLQSQIDILNVNSIAYAIALG